MAWKNQSKNAEAKKVVKNNTTDMSDAEFPIPDSLEEVKVDETEVVDEIEVVDETDKKKLSVNDVIYAHETTDAEAAQILPTIRRRNK